MSTLKKMWGTIGNTTRHLVGQGWFRLYFICWSASFVSLMIFKIQWEYLRREEASLDYPIEVYYAVAVIFCAVLALVMALFLTGTLLGAYHFFLDCVPRKGEKKRYYQFERLV